MELFLGAPPNHIAQRLTRNQLGASFLHGSGEELWAYSKQKPCFCKTMPAGPRACLHGLCPHHGVEEEEEFSSLAQFSVPMAVLARDCASSKARVSTPLSSLCPLLCPEFCCRFFFFS